MRGSGAQHPWPLAARLGSCFRHLPPILQSPLKKSIGATLSGRANSARPDLGAAVSSASPTRREGLSVHGTRSALQGRPSDSKRGWG